MYPRGDVDARYFAFGSNMDPAQMTRRCPSARLVGRAVLPGFDLVFDHPGSYRPGGVASVAPAPGRRVHGVVWELSAGDLARLDEIEKAYAREEHEVVLVGGGATRVQLYRTAPRGVFPPDADYVELLVKGAVEAGLPRQWVERLRWLRLEAVRAGRLGRRGP